MKPDAELEVDGRGANDHLFNEPSHFKKADGH